MEHTIRFSRLSRQSTGGPSTGEQCDECAQGQPDAGSEADAAQGISLRCRVQSAQTDGQAKYVQGELHNQCEGRAAENGAPGDAAQFGRKRPPGPVIIVHGDACGPSLFRVVGHIGPVMRSCVSGTRVH